MNRRTDVCVVGAGPAGASTAAADAAAGRRVLLVDSGRHPDRGLELLSGRAVHTLAAIGALDAVQRIGTPCDGVVSRWGTGDFVARPAILDPYGGGWIVDRVRLDRALADVAVGHGAELVTGRAAGSHEHRTRLRDGRIIRSDEVVVATGSIGGLGVAWAGPPGRRDPTLVALVAALPAGAVRGLGHRLLVDRTAEGWWYALADADRTTIAYCLPADRIGRGAAAWQAACAAADWVPDAAGQVRPRARFRPVGRGPSPADPTIRLVGDAALSVDWLSGRGLALALEAGLDGGAAWYDEVAESHARQRRDVYRRMYHPENRLLHTAMHPGR